MKKEPGRTVQIKEIRRNGEWIEVHRINYVDPVYIHEGYPWLTHPLVIEARRLCKRSHTYASVMPLAERVGEEIEIMPYVRAYYLKPAQKHLDPILTFIKDMHSQDIVPMNMLGYYDARDFFKKNQEAWDVLAAESVEYLKVLKEQVKKELDGAKDENI